MIPLREVQSCTLTAPSNVIMRRNEYFEAMPCLAVLFNGLSSAFICILNCDAYSSAAMYNFLYYKQIQKGGNPVLDNSFRSSCIGVG